MALFTEQDLKQLKSIGKTLESVRRELEIYANGIPPVKLTRPCSPGDGIVALSAAEQHQCAKRFEEAMAHSRAMKFVAASGAGSRMFGSQIACQERGWVTRECLVEKASRGDQSAAETLELFRNLKKFAFYHDLKTLMASKRLKLEGLVESGNYGPVLENLLTAQGLGYANLPKGLIPFHSYPDGARTAYEEHLVESSGYLKDRGGVVRVHFTVSPEHLAKVEAHVRRAATRLESRDIHYDVTLSIQDRSTDSIVVERDNGEHLRDREGKLVFRPSGHGALLDNLNSLQADIVFVRTIDNVLPDRLKETAAFFRKVLGGYLIALQADLFSYLRELSSNRMDESKLQQIQQFAKLKLNLSLPDEFLKMSNSEKSRALFHKLNAPLRVCGMVKNPGYAGGRPFWIANPDGMPSLQIIEPAQVDMSDSEQNSIWRSCDFFNPADLACGVRNYLGKPFNLNNFSDPDQGFIAHKTYEGQEFRILERPGLWNGAMASWNSVFVEIPASILHPVKSILNLIKGTGYLIPKFREIAAPHAKRYV